MTSWLLLLLPVVAFASFANAGTTVYAIAPTDASHKTTKYYSIDPVTGAKTQIGDTLLINTYPLCSTEIDQDAKLFYTIARGSQVSLLGLDVNSGVVAFNASLDFQGRTIDIDSNSGLLIITGTDDQGSRISSLNPKTKELNIIVQVPLGHMKNQTNFLWSSAFDSNNNVVAGQWDHKENDDSEMNLRGYSVVDGSLQYNIWPLTGTDAVEFLRYDPTNKLFYGMNCNNFVSFDPSTQAFKVVATLEGFGSCIVVSPSAIDIKNGIYYAVLPSTAARGFALVGIALQDGTIVSQTAICNEEIGGDCPTSVGLLYN